MAGEGRGEVVQALVRVDQTCFRGGEEDAEGEGGRSGGEGEVEREGAGADWEGAREGRVGRHGVARWIFWGGRGTSTGYLR